MSEVGSGSDVVSMKLRADKDGECMGGDVVRVLALNLKTHSLFP